jgi:hypothetical protein
VAINSNYSTLGTRMFTASNIAFAPPVIPIHLPAASRLNANESIQARVAELQPQTAASSRITIESICAELAEATAVVKSKGQAQAGPNNGRNG